MILTSQSISNGDRAPTTIALAVPASPGPVEFGENRNPHLSWASEPQATRSFVVTCIDRDCPSSSEDVNQTDTEVPESLARVDFTHWLLADIPASVTEIAEGSHSEGITPGGKAADTAPIGVHGLNDYTSWFMGDPDMEGTWHGYDGCAPPWNDSIPHRYEFTVYAMDIDNIGVEPGFEIGDLRVAMEGHVLAEATVSVTYATNPRLF